MLDCQIFEKSHQFYLNPLTERVAMDGKLGRVESEVAATS
jgi:hypothetical protein